MGAYGHVCGGQATAVADVMGYSEVAQKGSLPAISAYCPQYLLSAAVSAPRIQRWFRRRKQQSSATGAGKPDQTATRVA
jgi:hypothetical protein